MGKLEKENARRTQNLNIQKYILDAVATGGFSIFAEVMPGVARIFDKYGVVPGNRQGEIIKRSFNRLKKRGLIEYELGRIALTPRGRAELIKMQLKGFAVNKPKKWDRKWRILLFDIPEKNRKIRDRLRAYLHTSGFYRLQDSAWLYPYDCEDFIALLKAELKPGHDVLYIIADTIENDAYLKSHFGL